MTTHQRQTFRIQTYTSPLGPLLLGAVGEHIVLCDWPEGSHRAAIERRLAHYLGAPEAGDAPVLQRAREELDAYFAGTRHTFDLPVKWFGTDFQCDVWQGLMDVPYGQTWSYAQLARHIARPGAVRALGVAVGQNALSILVPCHRIIGANGSLTGYGGGLEAKVWLLRHEKKSAGLPTDLLDV